MWTALRCARTATSRKCISIPSPSSSRALATPPCTTPEAMSKSVKVAVALALLVYVVAGFFAVEYAAGAAYFLINKTAPSDVGLDTWASYWHWYGSDPVQRKHLQLAAGVAIFLTYGVPLLIFA